MDRVKRDRFCRIAEQRTQKALDALSSLAKCAAKESYEYTDEDAQKILEAVEREVQKVRDAFEGRKRFSLTER